MRKAGAENLKLFIRDERATMRPNPIKSLLTSTILGLTGLASLSIRAQTRPRRVSPSPKNDPVILSETRPRQVKPSDAAKKTTQQSRSSQPTIKEAHDFLDRLYQLIEAYIKDSQYGPPY